RIATIHGVCRGIGRSVVLEIVRVALHGRRIGNPDTLPSFLIIDIDGAIKIEFVGISADIGQGEGIKYWRVGIELGKVVDPRFYIKGPLRIYQVDNSTVSGR